MIFYKVTYIYANDKLRQTHTIETTVDTLEGMLKSEKFEVIAYNKLEVTR